MHHELTPLTPEEAVVEIPDGLRSGQEKGEPWGQHRRGHDGWGMGGGVGVGVVFPWLCSLMMGDGHW